MASKTEHHCLPDSSKLLESDEINEIIQLSLKEDGVDNDLTTKAALFNTKSGKKSRATIVAKQPTVAAGYPIVKKILELSKMNSTIQASCLSTEGAFLEANFPWIILEGSPGDLLRIERTILNFLIRISGIATYTNSVVKAIQGTDSKILHTRKTAPGHRRLDIYGALVGGAHAHRRSLDDAILVKENHLRAAASFQTLTDGINMFRDQAAFVEIEVTNFVELKHALEVKPTRIMLDNFSIADVKRAVDLFSGVVELEASGGITLENVYEYAKTGVDYISMGALTHSAPAADLSMLFASL